MCLTTNLKAEVDSEKNFTCYTLPKLYGDVSLCICGEDFKYTNLINTTFYVI